MKTKVKRNMKKKQKKKTSDHEDLKEKFFFSFLNQMLASS